MKSRMSIFERADYRTDREYLVKQFLNSMYEQGYFVRALESMVKREDIVVNDEYCLFPDQDVSESEAEFEGVKFVSFDQQIVISWEACAAYIDQACASYLKLHPEDAAEIESILQSRTF